MSKVGFSGGGGIVCPRHYCLPTRIWKPNGILMIIQKNFFKMLFKGTFKRPIPKTYSKDLFRRTILFYISNLDILPLQQIHWQCLNSKQKTKLSGPWFFALFQSKKYIRRFCLEIKMFCNLSKIVHAGLLEALMFDGPVFGSSFKSFSL